MNLFSSLREGLISGEGEMNDCISYKEAATETSRSLPINHPDDGTSAFNFQSRFNKGNTKNEVGYALFDR